MKKLLNIRYSASSFNVSMLLLRVVLGIVIIGSHGYSKLIHFQELQGKFLNFFGIGTTASLSLAIFAEVFCSVLIILGLFTRLAAIPLIILLVTAILQVTGTNFFGKAELPSLYLVGFLVIFLLGPGKISVDGAINK